MEKALMPWLLTVVGIIQVTRMLVALTGLALIVMDWIFVAEVLKLVGSVLWPDPADVLAMTVKVYCEQQLSELTTRLVLEVIVLLTTI
jgi:hypothetical protein